MDRASIINALLQAIDEEDTSEWRQRLLNEIPADPLVCHMAIPSVLVWLTSGIHPERILEQQDHFVSFLQQEVIDISHTEQALLSTCISNVYHCKRCGSNCISVRSVQTRSADEGSTEIRTCMECGACSHVNC